MEVPPRRLAWVLQVAKRRCDLNPGGCALRSPRSEAPGLRSPGPGVPCRTRFASSSAAELEAIVSALWRRVPASDRDWRRRFVIGGGGLDCLAFDVEVREAPVEPVRKLPVPGS